MNDAAAPPPQMFQIVRNGDSAAVDIGWSTGLATVQKGIADALNARNLAFLLGAGCSSLRLDGEERGIATMKPLAEAFCEATLQRLTRDRMIAELEAESATTSGEASDELGPLDPARHPWFFTKKEVDYLER
jgi:hypothetical protein